MGRNRDRTTCASTTLLAESENVSVCRCSCGNVHLQIGSVMLTMDVENLFEVERVVRMALQRGPFMSSGSAVVN